MSCRDIRAGRPFADRALDDTRSSPRKEVPLFRRPSHSSLQSRGAVGSSRGRRFKPHRLQKCGNFRAISLALLCSRRTDGRDCFLADFLSRARLRPLFLAGGPKNITPPSSPYSHTNPRDRTLSLKHLPHRTGFLLLACYLASATTTHTHTHTHNFSKPPTVSLPCRIPLIPYALPCCHVSKNDIDNSIPSHSAHAHTHPPPGGIEKTPTQRRSKNELHRPDTNTHTRAANEEVAHSSRWTLHTHTHPMHGRSFPLPALLAERQSFHSLKPTSHLSHPLFPSPSLPHLDRPLPTHPAIVVIVRLFRLHTPSGGQHPRAFRQSSDETTKPTAVLPCPRPASIHTRRQAYKLTPLLLPAASPFPSPPLSKTYESGHGYNQH